MPPLPPAWNFVQCVLFWEVLFQAARLLAPFIAKGSDEKGLQFRKELPGKFTSTLHALLLCYCGTIHVVELWDAPNVYKLQGAPEGDRWHAPTYNTKISNMYFMAYLIQDIGHLLYNKAGMDMVFHHLAYVFAGCMGEFFNVMPFPFGWLVLMEVSTPFLNARWLLRGLGHDNSAAAKYLNLAFGGSFFVMRVLVYSAGLYHLWTNLGLVSPNFYPALCHACLATVGFVLNLGWMRKIVFIMLGKSRPGKAKAADE